MYEKFLQNITPREYQKKILEKCIEKNCLVVLPTGLGKTLIALMLTISRMTKHPGEKIVFLAPTKPLAEQHLNSFKKNLPELFAEMQLFTGAINANQRKKIWQNADIIFSTPQCVANDLRKNLYTLKDVCLLIEDEAHRCVKNYDYNYVAQRYKNQSLHPRILGLTASPGSEKNKIKEICRNLSIEEVELRTRESEDVKEYLQEMEFEKVAVDFPPEFEEIKQVFSDVFNRYVEELKIRKVLFGPATKTGLINLQKKIMATLSRGNKNYNYMLGASACAQAVKIQHSLELLETQTLKSFNLYLKNLFEQAAKKQSKGVMKLVAMPEFNFVYMRSNELLAKNVEHPKLAKLIEIIKQEQGKNPATKIIIFTQFRDTASIISREVNKIPEIKSTVFVGQAKKSSEKETTGLSQKEQKNMLQEFSEGKTNILVATCIAEEGLDIPEVSSVIFYEPVPSAIRTIQRAGRTARLAPGKILILLTKKTRDEAYFYISKAREKKMHSSIDSIKEDLRNNKTFAETKQKTLFD
jgi:Fanconi anemia group M protein